MGPVRAIAREAGREFSVFASGHMIARPTRKEAEDYFRYWTEEAADWEAADYMLQLKGRRREDDPQSRETRGHFRVLIRAEEHQEFADKAA